MYRIHIRVVASTVVFLCSLVAIWSASADIYRWDNGQLIQGTDGIEPGPGVQFTDWSTDERNLRYADFAGGLNLTGVKFDSSWLGHADFSVANLTNAKFFVSELTGAGLTGADLTNAEFVKCSLASANLSGANLTGAAVAWSELTNADLTGATLKNALLFAVNLDEASFDSATSYNQWTIFPKNFQPAAAGLTFAESPTGDFDANDALDSNDVDRLTAKTRNDTSTPGWTSNAMFDLNSDEAIDKEDVGIWVHNIMHTWYGDANLDGEFNTDDITKVLDAAKYETQEYAGWSEGDWNGDGVFDTGDLVMALEEGGYEMGPRPEPVAVPEPSGWLLLGALVLATIRHRRRRPSMRH